MSRDGKTRLSLKIQPPKSEEDTTSKSDTCELANDPPNEPGCWWRSPLGCPDGVPSTGRTKAKNGNDVEQGDGRNPIWRRDSAGDKGHDACEVSRRQILAQECGDGQVQAHWNPPLETPPPAPTSSPIPRVGKQKQFFHNCAVFLLSAPVCHPTVRPAPFVRPCGPLWAGPVWATWALMNPGPGDCPTGYEPRPRSCFGAYVLSNI